MKRVKNKKTKIKKQSIKRVFDIKKTLAFKVLVFCMALLMVLVVTYLLIYEPRPKEKEFEGELGTLCLFCTDNPMVLTVLNYTIVSDSLVNVNLNWSGGNVSSYDFRSLLIDFDLIEGIKYNITISSDLPSFGENKTYLIEVDSGSPINFSDISAVHAYAEVNIHLVQTGVIPEIEIYKDTSRDNLIHLGEYFKALTEINYSVIESPNNENINVIVNNLTKNISVSFLNESWFGTQTFNLTATEGADSLTTFFSIRVINEPLPVLNHEPMFNEDGCGFFSWNQGTNKTIDMDDCWSDEDEDNLKYEYSQLNDYRENISILNLSGNRLIFVPQLGFNKSTYLIFYANDSKVRVNHKVNLYVLGNSTSAIPLTTQTRVPELKSSVPAGVKVSFFINEIKRFSIIAENYENIEWYVDNLLVKEGVSSYIFEEKRPGEYKISVKIIKEDLVETRSWEVSIKEDEYVEESVFNIDFEQVIFYSIVAVLVIIILLIIWLLILERDKRNKRIKLGFGVSIVSGRRGVGEGSKQFNIPRD